MEYDSPSYKKMKDLIGKITEIEKYTQRRQEALDSTFENLRKRINEKSSFLRTTKNNIENIKVLYQKETFNPDEDGKESSQQSLEEMDVQIEDIKKKLERAKQRSQESECRTYITEEDSFEITMNKVVNVLDNLSKGGFAPVDNK